MTLQALAREDAYEESPRGGVIPFPVRNQLSEECSWETCGRRYSVTLRARPVFAGVYVALFALFPVYFIGASYAGMAPRAASDICPGQALAEDQGLTDSLFPLRSTCHWSDGSSTELVPAWINWLLLTLIGTAVILFVLGLWIASRTRAWPSIYPAE
jgi:hypothetical protein